MGRFCKGSAQRVPMLKFAEPGQTAQYTPRFPRELLRSRVGRSGAVGSVVRGKFNMKLTAIPVGGPYNLRLESGKESVEIKSFFVGDVWVMAGQSNMQGIGDMTGRAKPHPLIRNFSMRREWRLAEDPLQHLAESPDACHTPAQCSPKEDEKQRREAIKGVGAGIFFAREMVERSGGVPQGLICTAHGGTSMQQWSPDRKRLGGESLYASMLISVRATGQPGVRGSSLVPGRERLKSRRFSEVRRPHEEARRSHAPRFRPAQSSVDDRCKSGRFFLDGQTPINWNT